MLTGDRRDDATVTGQGQPWHHLHQEHTAWIREQIDQMDWSPAYRNKHLAALRGVLSSLSRAS
ncbi:hypothetical protein ACI2LC_29825 [Nonomuraea wenchangensis]|uniref:hypothetical protein n=1 Tax=Nonomuraea wenchangensis TaxID=568860 RepID=UPI00378745F6